MRILLTLLFFIMLNDLGKETAPIDKSKKGAKNHSITYLPNKSIYLDLLPDENTFIMKIDVQGFECKVNNIDR